MVYALYSGLSLFLSIIKYAIIIDMLLSWFLHPNHQVRVILARITGPIVAPFRILMNKMLKGRMMMFDFAPLLAYFAIEILQNIILSIFRWFI